MCRTSWCIRAVRPIVVDMNTPVGDERTVRRLRNDVEDIYDILGNIKGTVDRHSATLDEHSTILNEHSTTLDEHTLKLDQIIDLLHAK